MRRALLLLVGWLLAAGCSKGLQPSGAGASASASVALPAPPVFLEDDYPRAREEALRRGVPLVVVAWSPWCTDCLGLRSYVFPDEALSCISSRFVWLSLDVDLAQNARFWDRFPVDKTPSLWVIEPERQRPVLQHIGPLTVHELQEILGDAEHLARPRPAAVLLAASASGSASAAPVPRCPGAAPAESASASAAASAPPPPASSSSAPPPPPPPPPRDPRVEAEAAARGRLMDGALQEVSGSFSGAEHAFLAALQAPHQWSRRARAVDGALRALSRRNPRRCVELAEQELPRLPPGTFTTNAARQALLCAQKLAERGNSDARHAASTLEAIARSPGAPLLPSHRSNLFEELIRFHKQDGAREQSQRLTREWVGFLETEAMLARKIEQRRVFDDHLQRAYAELGTPLLAVPALEQSLKEVPDDPVVQARLARSFFELRRWEDSLALLDRALPHLQGQGRLRVLLLKADVLERMFRKDEAHKLLDGAVDGIEKRPLTVEHDRLSRELRRRLAAFQERKL